MFLKRAAGTIIEKDYDILCNLFLVKMGVRPAFLLECVSYPEIDSKELLNVIRHIYPEFRYTIEHEIDDNFHRVFIHMNELAPKEDNHDIWVAKNLGFWCHGIPDPSTERFVVRYYAIDGDEKFNIYAEICSKTLFNREHFDCKYEKFNKVASQIGLTILLEIEELIPNEPEYWRRLLITNNLGPEHEERLVGFLWGSGLSSIYNNINDGKYTFDELLDNKRLLLFMILRSINDPFDHLYPLSYNVAKSFEQAETKLFSNLTEDPCSLFRKLQEESIVMKMLEEPIIREIHDNETSILFEAYDLCMNKN